MINHTWRITCQNCGKEVPPREGERIGFKVEESCPHCGAKPLRRHIELTLEGGLALIDRMEAEESVSSEEASELKKLLFWIRDNIKLQFDGIDLGFPHLISIRFKVKKD